MDTASVVLICFTIFMVLVMIALPIIGGLWIVKQIIKMVQSLIRLFTRK